MCCPPLTAIAAAEDFADGRITGKELYAVHKRVGLPKTRQRLHAAFAVRGASSLPGVCSHKPKVDGVGSAFHAVEAVACEPGNVPMTWRMEGYRSRKGKPEKVAQATLLRDVVGPLLFRPLTLKPSLLTDTVRKLAASIYEQRTFERMPVLADALEECGVTDEALLAHCRADVPHVRGCHVLDLILGKSEGFAHDGRTMGLLLQSGRNDAIRSLRRRCVASRMELNGGCARLALPSATPQCRRRSHWCRRDSAILGASDRAAPLA